MVTQWGLPGQGKGEDGVRMRAGKQGRAEERRRKEKGQTWRFILYSSSEPGRCGEGRGLVGRGCVLAPGTSD